MEKFGSAAVRLLVLLLGVAPPAGWADPREEMRLYMQGDFVYQRHCADCHGKSGRGDGPLAAGTVIRPRDFRKGVFKFRSTAMGCLPTDEDLRRTIRTGVAGSLMPAFAEGTVSEGDVRALIVYIKSMSLRWKDPELRGKAREVPEEPVWFEAAEAVKKKEEAGKVHFARHCASCHGEGGKGDGVAAAGLVDHWGEPIVAADLTKAAWRSGPGRRDLFRTVALGLDGTPMVGYFEPLGAEAIWEVIAYIEGLGAEE